MNRVIHPIQVTPDLTIGSEQLVLISGPCAIESYETTYQIALYLRDLTRELDIPFIFKASYDKANRTSHTSFRSIGFEAALEVLRQIKSQLGLPILTDIHETVQVERVSKIVDILQIPAFLSRQTDLLQTAGRTGLPVNIKRGQFMAPEDMEHVVDKVEATGNMNVFLTERGTSFGYHDLVVDIRSFPIMRRFAPVIFDVTHSTQQPGALGNQSGASKEFAPFLARAAAAAGVDGFFIETHPEPDKALSDGASMIPLDQMPQLLHSIKTIWYASHPFIQ